MTPIHHREPGPIIALLEDPRVTVEVILDGIHLHPVIYGHVVVAAGSDRVALVTDAIAAAGLADGDYVLGELKVSVADGVSKLADQDTIAGGTATTDRLFGNAVRFSGRAGPDVLLAAARQTSANPARVLGLTDRTLEPGGTADLVVLDPDLKSTAVMQRGDWVTPAPEG
jgi:N-acetylglucosamine-6-phosphate deacetylase